MKNIRTILIALTITMLLSACNDNDSKADGYGNFEATEITISAENNGKLIQFNLNEGDVLQKEQLIGYIDTIALTLKRQFVIKHL